MTEGSIAEYCRAAELIMRQLAGRIARHGGACLIIDYGKNDNCSDSLQAVSAHKPVDLLYQPGNADISHWVDFAALRRAAINTGARFLGPVTQADFLWRLDCANEQKMPRVYAMLMGDGPYLPRLIASLGRITWVPPLKWG